MKRAHRGFTLIEVVVVTGLVLLLMTITSRSLFTGSQRTSLSETVAAIVRDLRQQQILVVSGESADGSFTDSSVYFTTDRYVMYPGSVYSPTNPENVTVTLDPSIRISSVNLPDNTVVFSRGSGDVRNWSDSAHSVTVSQAQTGSTYQILVNKRGIVTVTQL